MSKKGTKALASATLLSLVLTTALSAGPVKADASNVTRTSGADRYATAAQVATKNWTSAKDVVLVCGEGYADAVSGSVLAKTLNAPILLTESNTLSADAKTALDTLKPTNVYVIGGTASIAKSVRDGLKASGYNLIELGGANRYATNVAVANELVKNHGVKADNVMVVGGEGFSDALSVAPVAAAKGQILLLGCNDQSTMQPVIDFVNTNKSKATVVGTSAVMGDSILKALGVDSSARINGGADRFATNINVLNAFKSDLKNGDIYVANATGDGYADALVASALAGKSASPLVLVDQDGSAATTNALTYIQGEMSTSSKIDVVGGTGVVSDSLFSKLQNLGPVTPVDDNTVKSVEAVGLNQFKVTFNSDVDEDSAEDVSNYKIDGTSLNNNATPDETTAVAQLQSDNRTALVTLSKAKEQQKAYTISVKNGVLTKDKSKNITAKDTTVTFSDTQAPTVSSVTPRGANKLTIKFTEPVKIPVDKATAALSQVGDYKDGKYIPGTSFTSKLKVNGQNLSSFGIDKDDSVTVTKGAVPDITSTKFVWADEVDIYLSSKLPSGSDTLNFSKGDASPDNPVMCDQAGFTVADQDQNFTVDAVSTKPTVKEATADADGTIWVRFDRPMDAVTAVKSGYYKLNDKLIDDFNTDGSKPTLSLKEGDCTVKIKGLKHIKVGSNAISVDKSVQDAYGNTVDDNTRVGFTMQDDKTKPTITNVDMVDSETVRVTFSKDIDAKYAENIDYYTLKDSSGVDITKHIRLIKPATVSSPTSTTTLGAIQASTGKTVPFDNDNVWDIKMWKNAGDAATWSGDSSLAGGKSTDDWRLTGSKYSLTIKNLIDTTANSNVLDSVTKELNGSDDVAPKITKAYAKYNANDKRDEVVVLFSEAMDSNGLNDTSNYKYVDRSTDTKTLPSGTNITAGNDSKSVTIELPTSYRVEGLDPADSTYKQPSNEGLTGTVDSDNYVRGIVAANLKDLDGNTLDSFSANTNVSYVGGTSTAAYKSNTYRTEYEDNSDNLLVKFQYDTNIDPDSVTSNAAFTVAGQIPDSVKVDHSDVVLKFEKGSKATTSVLNAYGTGYYPATFSNSDTDDSVTATQDDNIDKIEAIKLAGPNAQLKINDNGGQVTDITGAVLSPTTLSQVYNLNAAPKTTPDYWYATTEQAVTVDGNPTKAMDVVLTFDSSLYTGSGVRPDDFTFTDKTNGRELKADKAVVKGNTVVFEFVKATDRNSTIDTTESVGVQLSNKNVNITSARDGAGNYASYTPSDNDNTRERTVPVNATTTFDFLSLFGGSTQSLK